MANSSATDKTFTDKPGKAEIHAERQRGWRTLRRVSPFLWPADQPWVKRRVVLSLLLLLTAKLIIVGTPFLYKNAVDAMAGESSDPGWLLAVGTTGLVIAFGMARLMSVLFEELRNVVFARVGQRALRVLARETISHVHRLSLRYHISRKTGSLNRVIERGVKGVDFLLRFILFNIGPLVLELLLISLILIFVFDVWYLAVVVCIVTLYVAFTTKVTEWRVRIRREMNDQDKDANQKAIDSLLNFETVKYFGAEQREADRYDNAMAGYENASLRTISSLGMLNAGQSVILNTGLVLALLLAARDVMSGELTVGGFVMVNAYMMQVMMPLNYLGYVYREIRQSLVDMGEMFDLLGQPAEITDKPDAPDLQVQGGRIQLDNVHFSYEPDRPILQGISLTLEAGQTLAIVGPSGSGKSTIGRLLFRFYDVEKGALMIDGQDVRDVTQDSLHSRIGVVPQDTVLFNDTIYYNIAYGRPDASREDIIAAAKAARIHDFVSALPNGYDTTVGERGLKLSGGEKQRVGIARTLLKNPPILLLDEATSALDSQTERDIQESLKAMGQGRSVMTIAHRLSTVVDADQILVLQQGKIAERGTHSELLQQAGLYAQMWQHQLDTPGVSLPASNLSVNRNRDDV
ncbi:ABCB family ABC transporter ATP-binding protein/permease [Aliamphritea hakodatensis]|uniref:ABCB family ABC transporter ATP-binding protein/permease n=1 Tax=Aliamphritea hakodatensis TaxID=2895352 RepID=UPI0022FD8903|nr:ABC transporter ATP-binding protein/permease [Aliamphritea hakodatensis]